MLSNNFTLVNDVLLPKLLNDPLSFCSLINLDFLLNHAAQFDNDHALPLLVFKTLGFIFFVLFLCFKQYDSIVL